MNTNLLVNVIYNYIKYHCKNYFIHIILNIKHKNII